MPYLFCCESTPLSPEQFADWQLEEDLVGGAEVPRTTERRQKTPICPAESKRAPKTHNTEIIEDSIEIPYRESLSADDSGSLSSNSVSSRERKPSYPSRPENPDQGDEWTPEIVAFYYKVLTAVGRALKKSLSREVPGKETAWCITEPSDIKKYIRGLIYTEATPECFLVAILYLERFLRSTPKVPLTQSNVQLLYLTALTVAIKYVDDSYFNSEYYAKIGGLNDVRTLNRLELKFLFGLNFDLMVDREQYRKIERALLGTHVKSKKRSSRESKHSFYH